MYAGIAFLHTSRNCALSTASMQHHPLILIVPPNTMPYLPLPDCSGTTSRRVTHACSLCHTQTQFPKTCRGGGVQEAYDLQPQHLNTLPPRTTLELCTSGLPQQTETSTIRRCRPARLVHPVITKPLEFTPTTDMQPIQIQPCSPEEQPPSARVKC